MIYRYVITPSNFYKIGKIVRLDMFNYNNFSFSNRIKYLASNNIELNDFLSLKSTFMRLSIDNDFKIIDRYIYLSIQ
mgnify:CR=1 FL=1